MRTINIKIIASILLLTCGILFFSLAVQKYQVLTSSQATLNLPQCQIPEGSTTPSNTPCASCNIFEGTDIDELGDVTVAFGCQVVCNDTGNPLDMSGCASGTLPYSVSDASWYWCKSAGTHACTSQNELTGDLLTQIENDAFTDGGPWIMSRQGDTDFTANFSVPGYESCGRIQIDIETNQKTSYVINSGVDCEDTLIAMDSGPTLPPSPTFGFGFPEGTLTPTPFVVQPTIAPNPTATRTPTPTLSATPTPTASPIATNTPTRAPSGSITPSGSLTPSVTGSITPSISGSLSPSPSPTLTATPTPTATFTPSPTPTATNTPTPISDITVNGEAPGITSWVMMLVPAAIVLLGLLL